MQLGIYFQKPSNSRNVDLSSKDAKCKTILGNQRASQFLIFIFYSQPIYRYFENIRFPSSEIIIIITTRKTQFKLEQ